MRTGEPRRQGRLVTQRHAPWPHTVQRPVNAAWNMQRRQKLEKLLNRPERRTACETKYPHPHQPRKIGRNEPRLGGFTMDTPAIRQMSTACLQ